MTEITAQPLTSTARQSMRPGHERRIRKSKPSSDRSRRYLRQDGLRPLAAGEFSALRGINGNTVRHTEEDSRNSAKVASDATRYRRRSPS